MIQKEFAERAVEILSSDPNVTGLAVGGSWLQNELDAFSDLDLVLVTRERISSDKASMIQYAQQLGDLLSAFTGEHVGEPRLLICLYNAPLLHVDIKFLTIEEFHQRVETPVLLMDKEGLLQLALDHSAPDFPYPDHQWIEDRFWTWIHYALLKVGRGEYLEAFDFTAYIRMVVLGPLLHIANGSLPRGVRKLDLLLPEDELQALLSTIPVYNAQSLLESLHNAVLLYRELRQRLYNEEVILQHRAEQAVMTYLSYLQQEMVNKHPDIKQRKDQPGAPIE